MAFGLLGIEELTRAEVESILQRARFFQPLQMQSFKKLDTLRGKMIVNLFFEASTRTRTSFEIAAKRLGADTVSITASGSSVSKGESLVDTLNTLAAMHPDAIVMRHAASGAPHFLARHLAIPIVNAGDGTHEHPTQALLDALTILDRRDALEGLRVAIIGDIAQPDIPDYEIIKRDDGSFLVDAQVPFYDFLSRFHKTEWMNEGDHEFDTLAGFILNELEHIPATGETFEWRGFSFEIIDMDGQRIDKLLVKISDELKEEMDDE